MTELDIWQTFQMSMTASGTFFFGCAFLIWVGFRVSMNIRNSGESNLLMKIIGSLFCLCTVWFMAVNVSFTAWNINSIAGGLQYLASTEVVISDTAQDFIASANPGAPYSIAPNAIQGLFLACVLLMQQLQIWGPKK